MVSRKANLSRDDFSSSVCNSVRNLINDKDFTDVTLVSENDQQIKAHKVILSSNSKFFKTVLTMNNHQHPLIYLKGVQHKQLKQMMEFIYIGEVQICEPEVDSFVELGKDLGVEGLVEEELEEYLGDVDPEQLIPKVELDSSIDEKDDMAYAFTIDDVVDVVDVVDGDTESPPKKKLKRVKIKSEDEADGKDKHYRCTQCDFSTEHNVSLKKHRLSKHDAVRFQCERCEKSYTDSSALLRHKKAVHDGFVYKCETCEKQFSDGGALTRHKKNIHSSIN